MNNQKNEKLSVDALTSRLLRRRTIIPLFSWPLDIDNAVRLLSAAYRAQVIARHCQFIDDQATNNNIRHVADALIHLGKPKFGIILCGDCGNGKSTMLNAIQIATGYLDELGYFKYRSCYGDLRVMNTSFTFIDAVECAAVTDLSKLYETADLPVLAIDDLGQEPLEVQVFGNILNPMMTVLERRYAKNLSTFITTNLSPEQLGSRYGKRIRDRLREMTFVIPFDNPSYRK